MITSSPAKDTFAIRASVVALLSLRALMVDPATWATKMHYDQAVFGLVQNRIDA